MIRARCHLSACISGSNSVKSQLIFINRQYNHARSCVKNTIPHALIHSHSLRQWFGEELGAVFWLIIFFRAKKKKNAQRFIIILWPAQMGKKLVLQLQNIWETHLEIYLILFVAQWRWWQWKGQGHSDRGEWWQARKRREDTDQGEEVALLSMSSSQYF